MITKNWRELVRKTLEDRPEPSFIIVFGSYAKGTARHDSDLDLAFYSEKKLTNYQLFC